jgi:hypothetical protein
MAEMLAGDGVPVLAGMLLTLGAISGAIWSAWMACRPEPPAKPAEAARREDGSV